MHEPKLRFKADNGSQFPNWDEHKIKEFLTESNILGHTGKEAKKLTVKLWAKGVVPKENIFSGSENTQYYIRHSGQLMYGKLDFLNCAFGIVPFELDGYESTLDSPAFDVHDISDKFLLSYITRKSFYKKNGDIANGSRKAKRIHPDVFGEMSIMVPSFPEQKKIAEFLSTIDTVVEKQKETVSAWEERKKGVMQKLFSQEVRFKIDDGTEFPEWEVKMLNDVSERILVGLATTVTPYYRKKGRPMFRNLNIKQGYLDDDDMLFLDDNYADSQKNKVIHVGDILTVHTGNIGWSCLVPEKYEGALSFTTLITTVKSNIVSNKYVCAFLNSPMGMNRMKNLAFSGGRANLNTSEFQKVQVPIPCLTEQQKIADCLSSLDEVIKKQKETLAAWEELKKGLLQQMFV